MGARGPARKPTRLKVIEGNPGHQKLNDQEPQPKPIRPSCPTWLDVVAKREWRRIALELEQLGLLTRIDRAALAAYCQAWARWRQAEAAIAARIRSAREGGDPTGGLVFETEKGYQGPIPELGIAKTAMAQIRAFGSEFGLTPASRSRVRVPEGHGGADDDPFEESERQATTRSG